MLAKNKKGDITSKFIIGLVLVIIGFIILLFFITRSDWFSVIDKEACHNSVVYRSTFNLGPIEGSFVKASTSLAKGSISNSISIYNL